jgi:hypothetical protein
MTQTLLREGDAVDLFVTGDPHLDADRANAYSIWPSRSRFVSRTTSSTCTLR